MSRSTIIVLTIGAIGLCAGAAIWITAQTNPAPSEAVAPLSPHDSERRKRAADFIGGDPNRDVRGGQEMKLKW
ncbi:entry exclusion protein TrbK [Mesorhizobium sp. NBSH29]|uniref:entry exclusion protein TrbK n=1 Tax=Mesorhizobium sp. NBSH29 TaxID=2654249 RepID=UPI0018966046|nr:entry exclusion protein TrbK [Mesorhizobium sp. NBSH29]